MGRIYEVYSILRRVDRYKDINFIGHQQGKDNTEGIANKLLENAIKNTDPGWQIGDVGLEQLKAVFNSNASVISGSTIEKILQQIQNALTAPNQAEMAEALIKIFTTQRQQFDNKIDEVAEKVAIAAIKKNLGLTD